MITDNTREVQLTHVGVSDFRSNADMNDFSELRIKPFNYIERKVQYTLRQGMPTNDPNIIREYMTQIPCQRHLIVEEGGRCYFVFFNPQQSICDYFIVNYEVTENLIASFGTAYHSSLLKRYHRRNPQPPSEFEDVDWQKEGF